MLATARALSLELAALLLDEPTEGFKPSMITLIRDTVVALKSTGVAIILVEQRVDAVLAMADQIAFVAGRTVAETVPNISLSAASSQFQTCVGI